MATFKILFVKAGQRDQEQTTIEAATLTAAKGKATKLQAAQKWSDAVLICDQGDNLLSQKRGFEGRVIWIDSAPAEIEALPPAQLQELQAFQEPDLEIEQDDDLWCSIKRDGNYGEMFVERGAVSFPLIGEIVAPINGRISSGYRSEQVWTWATVSAYWHLKTCSDMGETPTCAGFISCGDGDLVYVTKEEAAALGETINREDVTPFWLDRFTGAGNARIWFENIDGFFSPTVTSENGCSIEISPYDTTSFEFKKGLLFGFKKPNSTITPNRIMVSERALTVLERKHDGRQVKACSLGLIRLKSGEFVAVTADEAWVLEENFYSVITTSKF